MMHFFQHLPIKSHTEHVTTSFPARPYSFSSQKSPPPTLAARRRREKLAENFHVHNDELGSTITAVACKTDVQQIKLSRSSRLLCQRSLHVSSNSFALHQLFFSVKHSVNAVSTRTRSSHVQRRTHLRWRRHRRYQRAWLIRGNRR